MLMYLPLLTTYFITGLAGLAAVSNTLFMKNSVSLSPSDLITIGIWTSLPWSLKLVIGSVVDSFKLLGSQRKTYLHLANLLLFLGTLGFVDHTTSHYILDSLGEYKALVMTGILSSMGVVLADIIADTWAVELAAPKGEAELTKVQIWSRLAIVIGGLLGASVSGILAKNYQISTVFGITLILPMLSSLVSYLIKVPEESKVPEIQYKSLGIGAAFLIACIAAGALTGEYAQVIILSVSMFVVGYMLKYYTKAMNSETARAFVLVLLAIFLFRTTPGVGPALTWYYMDVQKFDEIFLGHLNTVSSGISLIVLFVSMKFADKLSTTKFINALTVGMTVLSVPDILIYYGYTGGINPRHLVLADSAAASGLAQLAMVPLGVFIAKFTPTEGRAAYLAITASLMNLALAAGDLITSGLNRVFVVTRTDFNQLGLLLISSFTIGLGLSIVGLAILYRLENKK